MDKREFMRVNQVNQMPRLVQAMAGRIYDAAFEEGRNAGYRQGVDAVAKKQEEIYKLMYDEGVHDIKKRLSVSFPAAFGKVLHRDFRFGAQRCNRALDAISEELRTMLDPAEAVKECEAFGFLLDWDDPFLMELEEETA